MKVFPKSSAGKESACSAGDPGSIAGSGRSTGEGKGYPLQYSGLEDSTARTVHGVATSQTRRCWQGFDAPGCPGRECIPILFTVATSVPWLMVLPPSSNPGVFFFIIRDTEEKEAGGEGEAEDGI